MSKQKKNKLKHSDFLLYRAGCNFKNFGEISDDLKLELEEAGYIVPHLLDSLCNRTSELWGHIETIEKIILLRSEA